MRNILIIILFCTKISYSQNFKEYTVGSTTDKVTVPKQGICLMGGSSEHKEAMKWFLKQANGGDVVVLRATGADGYNDFFYKKLGVNINSVTTFVIKNSKGAVDSRVIKKVKNAEAIWFAGGNQFHYVSYFKDNAMELVLNNFINKKKGVIGGTSAGMAILGSSYFTAKNGTLTSQIALLNPFHPRVDIGHNDFLKVPFLNNVITDSHYNDPDRRGRHSVFIARLAKDYNIRPLGIACNENTAICIDSDGKASVYGEYPNYQEFVYFLSTNNDIQTYLPEVCEEDKPLSWIRNEKAIKVYKVPGTKNGSNFFNLKDWKTGKGGEWKYWSIDKGVFKSRSIKKIPSPNTPTSIDMNQNKNVKIFPNPFSKSIHIDTKSIIKDLRLFDIEGNEIRLNYDSNNAVNTEHIIQGVYILKLKTKGKYFTFKIIKT